VIEDSEMRRRAGTGGQMKYQKTIRLFVMMTVIHFSFLVFEQNEARALPAPLQVQPGKILRPATTGSFIGGRAGGIFSLLGVKPEIIGGKTERITFLYGDKDGRLQKGEPGFFHISLDRNSRRIVLDFAQVQQTSVDQKKLAKIMGQSKFVESTEMTMDPIDGSTNVILNLNQAVRLRVDSSTGDQTSVVIELEPAAESAGALERAI
jgi:hypothetical protein